MDAAIAGSPMIALDRLLAISCFHASFQLGKYDTNYSTQITCDVLHNCSMGTTQLYVSIAKQMVGILFRECFSFLCCWLDARCYVKLVGIVYIVFFKEFIAGLLHNVT